MLEVRVCPERRTPPLLEPLLVVARFIIASLATLSAVASVAGSPADVGAPDVGLAAGHFDAAGDPFTIDVRFERAGIGKPVHSSTGCGDIVPLIVGIGNRTPDETTDLRFVLGVKSPAEVLALCIVSGDGAPASILEGTRSVDRNRRHRATARYDGRRLELYLDGTIETSSTDLALAWSGIRAAASDGGIALPSSLSGSFGGSIEDVRVWGRALSDGEIFDDSPPSGGEKGAAVSWPGGFGAGGDACPDTPGLVSPSHASFGHPLSVNLEVSVSDPDGECMDVSFYGRKKPPAMRSFTLVTLPDTQYYSKDFPEFFRDQTAWVHDNKWFLNIQFVTHLGDVVERADNFKYEWENADDAMRILDGLVRYGALPGNHDMELDGSTRYYDAFFPVSRYESEAWYAGHYNANRNSYQLFSVGPLDFIVIHLEFQPPDDVVSWANAVLAQYADRRAILSTHDFLDNTGNPSSMSQRAGGNTGEELWEKLVRINCNVFMVVNGHDHLGGGEARTTTDNDCGKPVHQMLQNYQERSNGGDGWLRYYMFLPWSGKIQAYTYTPTYDALENDDDSRFSLDYPMGVDPFELIGTQTCVPSGSHASVTWNGLDHATRYQWYAMADDGTCETFSSFWHFTTEQDCSSPSWDDSTCDGVDDDCDGEFDEDFVIAPTSCGEGKCAGNTGESICQNGAEVDTCNPYEGASLEWCDGLDNDCDGAVDEFYTDTDRDGVADCVDNDDDNDGLLDGEDNCWKHANPTQSDFDGDQIGDHCDKNDGLIYVEFNEPRLVEWQEEYGYDSWNVYRGDLDLLKTLGMYTQHPSYSTLSERHCGLTEAKIEDENGIVPGKCAYFLVTGVSGGVESGLGTDSSGQDRPNDNPCP